MQSKLLDKQFISYSSNNEEVTDKVLRDRDAETNYCRKENSAGPSVCDKIMVLMFLKGQFTF